MRRSGVTSHLECHGELVEFGLDEAGELVFYDYDIETDLAAVELGFEPSKCVQLYDLYTDQRVKTLLTWFIYPRYLTCQLAVDWFKLAPVFDADATEVLLSTAPADRDRLIAREFEEVMRSYNGLVDDLELLCSEPREAALSDLYAWQEILTYNKKQIIQITEEFQDADCIMPHWVWPSMRAAGALVRHLVAIIRRPTIAQGAHLEMLFDQIVVAVVHKDGSKVAGAVASQMLHELFDIVAGGQAELVAQAKLMEV